MTESGIKSLKRKKTAAVWNLISILFLFPSVAFSQANVLGTWEVSDLVGLTDFSDYTLISHKENDGFRKISLVLAEDGKFMCGGFNGPRECLNECNISTSGEFEFVGENYIRFILQKIRYSLFCIDNKSKSDMNYDLGLFYLERKPASLKLIKSTGDLEEDKINALYSDMIDLFESERKDNSLYYFLWGYTKGNTPEEIVKDCIDYSKSVDFSQCKILYSKKENSGQLILLQEKDKFHFVVYSSSNQKVSLAYPR
jgi:hypothetical protein